MKSLAHLNKYFFKYKWRFILGILFVVSQNFFAIYPAQVVRKSLDTVVSSLKNYQTGINANNDIVVGVIHQIFIFLLIVVDIVIFIRNHCLSIIICKLAAL